MPIVEGPCPTYWGCPNCGDVMYWPQRVNPRQCEWCAEPGRIMRPLNDAEESTYLLGGADALIGVLMGWRKLEP